MTRGLQGSRGSYHVAAVNFEDAKAVQKAHTRFLVR